MITEKQQIVFDFIESYQIEHGKSPTIREIREFLGVSSDNSVLKHLKALTDKGVIEKDDTPRGIKLFDSVRNRLSSPSIKLPLLGFIPAGGPVMSEEYIQSWRGVSTEDVANPEKSFLLEVTGDSMQDAGILEGDLLIVDSSVEPKIGDIVVALVDNQNTVKKLMKDSSGKHYLKPENKNYSDIYPDHDLEIQGVVISLIRQYA
jgi:repressor LexA